MLIQPTERAEHDRRVNNMSIRKVVAGLLIAAGIAIMAVPFFWRTTGEKQTEQLISEFEQTLEDDYDEETDVEEKQTSISKEDEAILKEGGVIGIIEIPGLDIRYPVMEGTTSKVLNAGIGHIEETAGIGESGSSSSVRPTRCTARSCVPLVRSRSMMMMLPEKRMAEIFSA